MPPDQRLRRKTDFDAVFREGTRAAGGPLALRARVRDEAYQEHPCRFGFAISSRLGGAVRRNRIRRRLKESARQINVDGACAGLDFVVIARQGAVEAGYAQLDDTLRRLVRRAAKQSHGRRVPRKRRGDQGGVA